MAGEIGFGAGLAYSDTLGGTYTAVARITEINGLPITATRVDTTHHGLTDAFRTRSAGLGDAGEVDVTIQFAKADVTTIYGLHRTEKFWRLRFPLVGAETVQSMWRCAGFVADIQTMTPIDDMMVCVIKIVMSGKPTFTEGS